MNLTPAGQLDFDDPRRRLVWTVPLGVALWIAVLLGFSWLLERTAAPPPEFAPVQARIVELPPAGLQGGVAAPAAKSRVTEKSRPLARFHTPSAIHRHREIPRAMIPLAPPSPAGNAKPIEAPRAVSSRPPAAAAPANPGRSAVSSGTGTSAAAGAGLGGDSSGARAIFAPTPVIPDDLREQAFDAIAVAHFKVAPDGTVAVALTELTQYPELNQILIDTLKQWRFFPALRDGTPVSAEFDLRIPVSVH